MIEIKCNGKTAEDCWGCGKYYSAHSEHYCRMWNRKVAEIKCSIGGCRTFNKDGKRID